MDKENLNELLKKHFATSALSDAKVRGILAECDIARSAYRWRLRALGASSIAAAALLALALILASPPTLAPASPEISETPPPPAELEDHKLVAVMIHSTDCPNSRAMDPVFAELQEKFIGESVLFIKFDYSSDCARHQAELLSKNLGLEIIYEQYKKTGEIVLVSSCGKVRNIVDRGETIATATHTIRETLAKTTL